MQEQNHSIWRNLDEVVQAVPVALLEQSNPNREKESFCRTKQIQVQIEMHHLPQYDSMTPTTVSPILNPVVDKITATRSIEDQIPPSRGVKSNVVVTDGLEEILEDKRYNKEVISYIKGPS